MSRPNREDRVQTTKSGFILGAGVGKLARVSALALTLAVTSTPGLSRAEPADKAAELVARDHYVRAKQLVTDNKLGEAYVEFEAGYKASGRAQFLFNMAECERALGATERARELYQRYLAASPNGELAAAAHVRLSELPAAAPQAPSPGVAIQSVAAPKTEPAPAPVAATPARTTVVIPPPSVAAEAVPLATTVAIPELPPPSHPHHTALWVGIAAGAAAVIAGSVVIYAASRHSPMCTPPACVVVQ
jgi:hypothetical protein